MDVEKLFHMTGGLGENSYAKNSSFQKAASDMVKHITMKALQAVYEELAPNSVGIADLGCSCGPNTLSIIKDMLEAIEAASSKTIHQNNNNQTASEIRVYLNDLPTNDFNSVFKSLPDFYRALGNRRIAASSCHRSVYIAACPGSFYGRLFPNNSLHFLYSSYSLHWLSKVPPGIYDEEGKSINKGSVYISKSSNYKLVSRAYFDQFQEDFSLFLKSRSQELTTGGRMVLIFLGRASEEHIDRGNSFFWQLLSRSLSLLVSKGDIKQEDFDSYDVHFYAASKEEIEGEVKRERSFELEKLEMFEIVHDKSDDSGNGGVSYGSRVAMTVRAIQESIISHHFGDAIMDNLFETYASLVDHEIAVEDIKPITFLLVLRKL